MVKAFSQNWVTVFGSPITILTDRTAHFEYELFNNLFKLLGSERIRCTTYHPQDGKTFPPVVEECYNITLKPESVNRNPIISYVANVNSCQSHSPCLAVELVFGMTPSRTEEFISPCTEIGIIIKVCLSNFKQTEQW